MEGDIAAKQNGLANHGTSNHVSSMNHVGGGDKSGETKHQSHSGSSSKHHKDGSHKHHSSSHKSSSSSSSKHKDGSSHKSRDGHSSSSSKDKHHHSSSHKHKDGSSSHKSSSSSSKEHKSSSSSGHKDKEHRSSSSSGHKDKEHKSGSSSSHKDREHKSSSSGSHKEHKSSSSSKEHKSSSSSSSQKTGSKPQVASPSHKPAKEGSKPSSEGKDRPDGAPTLVLKKSPDGKMSSSVKTEPTEAAHMPKVKAEPTSPIKKKVKEEVESDDDVPLSARTADVAKPKVTTPVKAEKRPADDSDEDAPLSARVEKVKKQKIKTEVGKKRKADDYEDEKPLAKKKKKKVKEEMSSPQKGKKKKKTGEPEEKWKWWEELDSKGNSKDGTKWHFLEHKGPVFAPDYEPLPKNVKFYYEKEQIRLSKDAEEVATFYGRMLDHDYTTKDVFNKNFLKDWRKVMTDDERKLITDIKKCNFRDICEYFKEESERKKNRSKEERQKLKEENAALVEEYGFCIMDGHKEKIGNFRIEPPGLFRGRGDHPKQGMHKTRTQPEDVIINCSRDSEIPVPPPGHKWKKVTHDNTVSWLASWNENIQGSTKYIMLNASSKLKGIKDFQKYEIARNLYKHVDRIRAQYHQDFKSKEMRIRQRSVALYFIDKLALRAGNEKDEGETADTVGCCSLRVEHIKLHEKLGDQECVVEFDFLGKDSIRYQNSCPVERRVFKNVQLFMENKNEGDDLFDRLNTAILNKHLNSLMEGLTAKVFRTFNASRTLQEQLKLLTKEDDPVAAKMLSYNRANRAVAVLCNHQRAVPKNFSKQMENIQGKIDQKKAVIKDAKKQVKAAKIDFKKTHNQKDKINHERRKKQLERLEEQLTKLEVQQTDKDENKQIALGTSKLNYLDPRISVAWCKKFEVPIEKIYNKTQRDKFAWAIEMVDEDFEF